MLIAKVFLKQLANKFTGSWACRRKYVNCGAGMASIGEHVSQSL